MARIDVRRKMREDLEAIAAALHGARRVLAITGAGISADSGLPTYRGVGGLYEDAATEDAVPIEEALSGPMFRRDPGLTWKYIYQIESACRGAGPNAGHRALAALQHRFDALSVITQNVDGFHRQAGSRDVIEMHGNVHELYCIGCGWKERVQDFSHIEALPPTCPDCGAVVRPNTVLFGEMLPTAAVAAYERALAAGPDAVISIGTTALFPYIAGPVFEAARRGALTVEINPGDSDVSAIVDYRVRGRAAEALPLLAELLYPGG